MQIKNMLTLGLFGMAAAAPMTIKDLTSAINGIATALNSFDTSVKALTPTSNPSASTAELVTKSSAILEAIKTGTDSVTKSDKVALSDAVQLVSASTALTKAAQVAIDDLIAKKPIIDKAGQTATTLKQLQDQKAATAAFITVLTSKLPSAVSGIANQQASAATAAIQKGVVAFGGQ